MRYCKVKNKSAIWLIGFLLIILNSLNTFAQTVYLPHYSTKDGLLAIIVFISTGPKMALFGLLLMLGVSRFDGAVFENFSVDDGLPDNQILQLREDSKGRIWFMALNGQLSYFLNGKNP